MSLKNVMIYIYSFDFYSWITWTNVFSGVDVKSIYIYVNTFQQMYIFDDLHVTGI